jgi:hypothetical protein
MVGSLMGTLCWALSVVFSVFDRCDISSVGCTPSFG